MNLKSMQKIVQPSNLKPSYQSSMKKPYLLSSSSAPVEKRGEYDQKELYSGDALTVDDFVEVARRIQPEIIPER